MDQIDRLLEIVATYQKHRWVVARVLLTSESAELLAAQDMTALAGIRVEDSTVDAVWFSRSSHNQREAWELRLVAETPYALFETFAEEVPEAEREVIRRDMETRMREYVAK